MQKNRALMELWVTLHHVMVKKGDGRIFKMALLESVAGYKNQDSKEYHKLFNMCITDQI